METKTATNQVSQPAALPNTLENFWANRPGLKEKCEGQTIKAKGSFSYTVADATPKGYGPTE